MSNNNEIALPKEMLIVSETDTKGNIIFANKDFCTIAGYTLEELVGKPHNILRHPDMPKVAFQDLWDTIKKGKIWNGIVKNKVKDSSKYYWVNATVYESKNQSGEKRYISVRVKPTKEEVENAIALYRTLR